MRYCAGLFSSCFRFTGVFIALVLFSILTSHPIHAQEAVEIDEPELTCGSQEITISGTSSFNTEVRELTISSPDISPTHQHIPFDEANPWNIGSYTFSVGTHTITAEIKDFECEVECQIYGSDTWEFTIDECEEESSTSNSEGTSSTSAGSTPTAPICTEAAPIKTGANFHVYRNGPDAILKWLPTGGDKAHIYYKQVGVNHWQYALRDIANTGYTMIHDLGNLNIVFALQQANGCAGGPLTSPIIDGLIYDWVLFR